MQVLVHQGPFDELFVEQLFDCSQAVFEFPIRRAEMRWRLSKMPDVVVHSATWGDEFVGFKIAYASRRCRLYSWLGGVLPRFRRRGVARALMDAQHAWAKEKGYLNVETGTVRNNQAMLALNLSCGFEIIGTYSRASTVRVMMAKRL